MKLRTRTVTVTGQMSSRVPVAVGKRKVFHHAAAIVGPWHLTLKKIRALMRLYSPNGWTHSLWLFDRKIASTENDSETFCEEYKWATKYFCTSGLFLIHIQNVSLQKVSSTKRLLKKTSPEKNSPIFSPYVSFTKCLLKKHPLPKNL